MSSVEALEQWLDQLRLEDRRYMNDDSSAAGLYPFQKDAFAFCIDRLTRFGFAILADDVGLGKSYVARAVIKKMAPAKEEAWVIAPAAILPQWRSLLGAQVRFLSYAAMSRSAWSLQDMAERGELPKLLVIDEAHRLRHRATKRYAAIQGLVGRTPALLVSATPDYGGYSSLRNLLALAFPVPRLQNEAQHRAMRDWAARFVLRRTHEQVISIGTGDSASLPDLVRSQIQLWDEAAITEFIESIEEFSGACFPEGDTLNAGFANAVLLRRLAIDPSAFLVTLERCLAFIERALEATASGRTLDRREFHSLFGTEAGMRQEVLPFIYSRSKGPESNGPETDWAQARSTIVRLIARVRSVSLETKTDVVYQLVERSVAPVLVMTSSHVAASRLYERLKSGFKVGLLTGSECRIGFLGSISRAEVLARASRYDQFGLQVLVATDVVGEGVNLGGFRTLIHYDQPWTPGGIVQREGRVRRLGAGGQVVETIQLLPPPALEKRLGILSRLQARSAERRELCEINSQDVFFIQDAWTFLASPIDSLVSGPLAFEENHAFAVAGEVVWVSTGSGHPTSLGYRVAAEEAESVQRASSELRAFSSERVLVWATPVRESGQCRTQLGARRYGLGPGVNAQSERLRGLRQRAQLPTVPEIRYLSSWVRVRDEKEGST
ncbi:MAG: hypothetical protein KC561_00380 [Myxococcales bacterium]|nr:hypothetical protein [Myxococcales bacterium]